MKLIFKENKRPILLLVFLVFLFTFLKFKIYYSCDFYKIITDYTYNKDIFNNEYIKGLIFDNGRPLQALIWTLFFKINLDYKIVIYIYKFIGDILLFLSIFDIYLWLKDFIKNKYLATLLSTLLLLNPFTINFFMFDEAYMYFLISIYLSIKAFTKTIEFLENKNLKDFIIINIILLSSVLIYQIPIGFYAVLLVLHIFLREIDFKKFIQNNMYLVLFYFIPTIISILLSLYVFNISKLNNNTSIMLNPFKIFTFILNWLQHISYIVFNNNYILIFFLIVMYFYIFIKINFSKNIKNINLEYLKLSYFIFMALIIPMAPYVSGAAYYLAIRIVFPLSIIFIGLIIKLFTFNTFKIEKILIIIFSIFILIINLFFHFDVLKEGYIKNEIEENYANQIVKVINEYEDKENITINYINYYYNKNTSKKINKDFKYDQIIMSNAFVEDWSRISFITFFTGRTFLEGNKPEEFLQNFSNLDNIEEFGIMYYYIKEDTLNILIK